MSVAPTLGCRDNPDFDRRLVQGLIGRDPEAWRQLVDGFGPLIRSRVADVARRFGRGRDTAGIDDVTAEVFASLLAGDAAPLRAFAGRSRLGTYLTVIATRVAMRNWSRLTRNPADIISQDPIAQGADSNGTIEDAEASLDRLIKDEDKSRLLALIGRLPDRQRELIELHYVRGMTYTEIRDRSGVPIGSIGPTLRRAEQRLRQWIEEKS